MVKSWYSVAFPRTLESVNIAWWTPLCLCLWKLTHLLVLVTFCSACSYLMKAEVSPDWLVDCQNVRCQCLDFMSAFILILCWLYFVRRASFPIITVLMLFLPHMSQRHAESGFQQRAAPVCSTCCALACWPQGFRGGRDVLAFQLVRCITVLSWRYKGTWNGPVWAWPSVGWNLWFGQS